MDWFRLFRRRHEVRRDIVTRTIYRDYRDKGNAWTESAELAAVLNIRADAIASLPLHVFEADGLRQIGDGHLFNSNFYALLARLVRMLDMDGVAWLWNSSKGVYIVPDSELETDGEFYYVWTDDAGRRHELAKDSLYKVTFEAGILRKANLRRLLDEQEAAWEFRRAVWKNSGQVGGWISRAAGLEWSDEDRTRFTESWHEFTAGGARAGEFPVIEDGMTLHSFPWSAKEAEWLSSAQHTRELICNLFNVPVTFLTNGEVSKEAKTYFYTETLWPIIRCLEEVFTAIARRRLGGGVYVKFNLDAKLAGSFEERASVFSTAVGAPIMLVNEARNKLDMPPVEGGDELVVPLNVTQGGVASPQSGQAPSVAVENAKLIGQLSEGGEA